MFLMTTHLDEFGVLIRAFIIPSSTKISAGVVDNGGIAYIRIKLDMTFDMAGLEYGF
jgi:hypothetical protein